MLTHRSGTSTAKQGFSIPTEQVGNQKTSELQTFRNTPVWSLLLRFLAYPLEAALWLASGITLARVKSSF